MDIAELLGGVCIFTLVLGLFIALGHGLWLLAALILRTLFGSAPPPAPTARPPVLTYCVECGAPRSARHGICPACGHAAAPASPLAAGSDLEAAARQLERWQDQGRLPVDLYTRLQRLVEADRRRVRADTAPTERPPVPSAAIPERPRELPPDQDAALRQRLEAKRQQAPVRPAEPEPVVIEAALVTAAPTSVAETPAAAAAPSPRPLPAGRAPAPWDIAPPKKPAGPTTRQRLADVLQAFMEAKNIRWAEVISGLLIVVSAVGLVISLRSTLDKIPYFPALSFLVVTAMIHAAGLYSLHRWNLKATSRAVLIIATLLVPLAFVASIVISGSGEKLRPVTDPVFLMALVVGTASFATMNFLAVRALSKLGWWRLMVAVLGPSLGQVLINRLQPTEGPVSAGLAMFVPLAAFLAAQVGLLRVSQRRKHFAGRAAQQFFLEVGLGAFAFLAAVGLYLGLHIHASGWSRTVVGELSPILSVAAVAWMAAGLLVHRRLGAEPKTAGYRTAGTALAIGAGVLMLVTLAFAWPSLPLLITVGLLNFVALSALAWIGELPVLHVPAVGCLTVAYLAGFHLLRGTVAAAEPRPGQQLIAATLTGGCAVATTVLTTLVAAAGAGLWLVRRRGAGLSYFQAAGGLAVVSLGLAAYAGYYLGAAASGDWATLVFWYFAAAALAAGRGLAVRDIALGGSVLLLAGCVHGLWRNEWLGARLDALGLLPGRPVLAAFLMHAIVAGSTALRAKFTRGSRDGFVRPVGLSALVTSACAVPFAVYVSDGRFGEHAVYMACAAVVWLGWALVAESAPAMAVFQGLATVALAFAVTFFCAGREWWSGALLDARHVYAQGGVLAAWCAGWAALRGLLVGWVSDPTGSGKKPESGYRRLSLWPHGWVAVDQVLLGLLVLVMVMAAYASCGRGLSVELGLDRLRTAEYAADAPHRLFGSGAGWWALSIVLLALGASLWERLSLVTLAGMVVVSAAVPLLIAGRFEDQQAVASALRWLSGAFCAAWCVPACIWGGPRPPAEEWAEATPLLRRPADVMRVVSLAIGGTAVLVLTTMVVGGVAAGQRPGGPAAESLFARMGPSVSYAVPLGTLVVMLGAYALREARDTFAFAASLVFQYLVTLACLLPALSGGEELDAATWARVLQANAVGLAAFLAVWIAARRWLERSGGTSAWSPERFGLLNVQIGLTIVAFVLITVWTGVLLWLDPEASWPSVLVLGRWPSYVGTAIAVGSLWWLMRRSPSLLRWHAAASLAIAVVNLVAASLHAYDSAVSWHGFHAMLVGWLAVGATAVVLACRMTWSGAPVWPPSTGSDASPEGLRAASRVSIWTPHAGEQQAGIVWGTLATGLAAAGALRGGLDDPQRPWWSTAVALVATVLIGVLAVRGRQLRFAYAATALAAMAATLFWLGYRQPPLHTESSLVTLNALAILVAAGVWLALELRFQRRGEPGLSPRPRRPAVHRVVCIGAIGLCGLMTLVFSGASFLGDGNTRWPVPEIVQTALVFAALGLLLVGSLWDRRAWYPVVGMYVGCLCVAAFVLLQLSLGPSVRAVMLTTAWAGLVAGSGWLWYYGANWAAWGERLGVPQPVEILRRTSLWLPATNVVLGAVVLLASLGFVSDSPLRGVRVAAACLPLLLAGGLAAMAQQKRRPAFQLVSILLVVVAGTLLGWADIEPRPTADVWLHRVIRLLMACAGGAFVLGVAVVRMLPRTGDWHRAVRHAAVGLGFASIAVLLIVLAMEAALFQSAVGAPVTVTQLAAVSVVLVALMVALISLAVLPGRDPLHLSERGRMVYVYAAQVTAALLFAHLYLARPSLFAGNLRYYWPYIVLAIAFAGVGVGELFQRLGWRVLAEPFQRSGAFLPLIPAIGWWAARGYSNYSIVLLAAGVLYMLVSFSRRSVLSGVLAALAGNGALWALLGDTERFSFFAHPQFWVIPPALSVLVAGQLNRRRLSPAQLAGVRYMAVSLIYLSSSFEMLKIGIGESLWPPVILICLSIVGVAFGIALQVRAYLYMGTAFILVSLVSMVANAARLAGNSWPWWAFGMAMGAAIMVLFGWFEKHRAQVTRLIERLRQWEK